MKQLFNAKVRYRSATGIQVLFATSIVHSGAQLLISSLCQTPGTFMAEPFNGDDAAAVHDLSRA